MIINERKFSDVISPTRENLSIVLQWSCLGVKNNYNSLTFSISVFIYLMFFWIEFVGIVTE